jgi:hypothetical protein
VKAANAHRPVLDTAQPRALEQANDLSWFDMTMAMKVGEEAGLPLRVSEVDHKDATLWLEHSAHFLGTLLAHLAR